MRATKRLPRAELLADHRSAWEMHPDGSYVQRRPGKGRRSKGSHQVLIEHAERRYKDATRLRRRQLEGIAKRRLR
jgi:polyphosphate kinase